MATCTNCIGSGRVEELSKVPDGFEGTPELSDLETQEVQCRRCGGDGFEYEGDCCPRCGSENVSSSLMPSSAYKQNCSDCGWWTYVG